MVDKRLNNSCFIFNEFNNEDLSHWFDFKQRKFLHNVDTFYYSVKFLNDFRIDSRDENVLRFRRFFKMKYEHLQKYEDAADLTILNTDSQLVLKPVTFSRFYTVCLSCPEYFDIFFAPVVPKSSDGGESLTCECIVQIRSYMLWQFCLKDCFENSYSVVKQIAKHFHLNIDFCQENRIDYCWHSNYLTNPEAFFSPENFYKMRVDRFKNATYVTNKVGSEDFEIDYVALGKRSDKVFVRIYQKTREVIEQGYKPWFLQIWLMNGLISKYDQYVYEKAYQKRSWHYRFYARLQFYSEYGQVPVYIQKCKDILSGVLTIEENDLVKFADFLTPRLNYVMNVEFQTMRRHSKSYQLIPFRDHRDKGECQRIYDYIDNRKIITEYLTNKVFRLVDYDPNVKKSERKMCAFWEALRRTKCIDVKLTPKEAKLVRNYNRKLSKEALQKRFINAAVTYGLYSRGENDVNPAQDAFELLLRMNDNDIHNARNYRTQKLRQLNQRELAEVFESEKLHRFQFLDENTGELYDYNSLIGRFSQDMQEDFNDADWEDI